MTDREDLLSEQLENQIQDWFDASVPPLDVFCQHRLARRASEIPEKGAWRLNPFRTPFHWGGGPGCRNGSGICFVE